MQKGHSKRAVHNEDCPFSYSVIKKGQETILWIYIQQEAWI